MNADGQKTGTPSHRRAVATTVVILVVVIGLLLAFALTLTRRLVDGYGPAAPSSTTTPAG